VVSRDDGANQEVGRVLRVLVVGHYASETAGGEGTIPLRLFGQLRGRGFDAWLITHERHRTELAGLLDAPEFARVVFTGDLPGFGPLLAWGKRLGPGSRTITWAITQLERQLAMVPVIRRLVRELGIDVVHQPISVSPVIPSPLLRLGAPVVMGPLNGGMNLPPSMRERDSFFSSWTKTVRPMAAAVLNHLVRGRLRADVVLVANDRTRALLPRAIRDRAVSQSDIGVELSDWPVPDERAVSEGSSGAPDGSAGGGATRFVFVGRLVDWKAVDVLLEAFVSVVEKIPAHLDIVGDGPERERLAEQTRRLGCSGQVSFHGWLRPEDCGRQMRSCDVFVSPSLQEAGGIAVIEAMACARPVIATAWGGHLDSVDTATGILVEVSSRAALVDGLADAMVRLARDPELRSRLGTAGRRRVEARYDWSVLVDRTLRIYDDLGDRGRPISRTARPASPGGT
jgi:glycosyltransferase involved in cell wall biosynthesis